MIWKKFCYWLYVKSGLRKRDEDNWWKGACHIVFTDFMQRLLGL
jgi:hypothetical protein